MSDVDTVFDYWVQTHSSTKGRKPVLSSERKKKIEKAIKEFGVDTTLRAIDGCLKSEWHMGENPTGTKYNDISLILRNAANIEKFAGLTDSENAVVASVRNLMNTATVLDQTDWVADLVDRAFATWNVDPTKARRHATWEAWRHIIQDLDPDECNQALTDIAILGAEYMPRPADIRRRVLRDRLTAPAPMEAWGQMLTLQKQMTSGAAFSTNAHACVFEAIRRIGGVHGLHTNGDREMFFSVYGKVVEQFELDVLAL